MLLSETTLSAISAQQFENGTAFIVWQRAIEWATQKKDASGTAADYRVVKRAANGGCGCSLATGRVALSGIKKNGRSVHAAGAARTYTPDHSPGSRSISSNRRPAGTAVGKSGAFLCSGVSRDAPGPRGSRAQTSQRQTRRWC